jgi:type I restriction enzyme R subunit
MKRAKSKQGAPKPAAASVTPQTAAHPRTTLLFFAANPEGYDALRLDKEAREIEAKIASALFRDCFELRTRWATRPADIVDALNDHRPGLVHFSGHGEVSGIVLESAQGDAREVGADGLCRVFATVKDEVHCVVLNACSTDAHAIALAQHIDAVIGMADSIDDEAAAVFSATFYRALASGRSVVRAYEQAIAMMVVEATGDDHVPKLHGRAGADLEQMVFASAPSSPKPPRTVTVVLDADLADIDPQKIGQLMGELRKSSRDLRLEIGRRSQGSVRLTVLTSAEGAERLQTLHASGELSEIRGFSVLAIEPVEIIDAAAGPEWREVEEPFLNQLASLGWKVVMGSVDHPSVTGRESFREVLIRDDLEKALRRINRRPTPDGRGKPWLDSARISQAIGALERISHPRLMEANQEATERLLKGIAVEGLTDWDQGRDKTVHYVDWDHPENNTFTAISQFKVDTPGLAKGSIRPDITLFINGIPIAVIECKSPGISEPIPSAIDQLRRYYNARKDAGEVEENEGSERLFYTNQFLIATSYDEARVGTIGAEMAHYLEWKDTAPVPLEQVQAELGKPILSSQNKLIAGMLRPEHLLDIIRHFTLYKQVSGRTVKVVCRYQQFRAVQYAMKRLLTGKTRKRDGEHDRRGGIIWHTQGSGKSLTMVFLVRKMRSVPELRRFKVVIVTDRKDLQKQLSETAALVGETVKIGKGIKDVERLLRRQGPEIVFATIQKYVDRELDARGPDDEVEDLGVLNDDESILVLVDEAHRSHGSALHARLLQALPNCARIGFTGTPIIMGEKKRTHDIFGEFIDRYTIRQSEADGATVPILYEGRFAKAALADGAGLDEALARLLPSRSAEEREALKRKYGTLGSILEASEIVSDKARDMLRHYVEHILPSGLKAQVVACSRRAAVRYQEALVAARDELVKEARTLDEATRSLDDLELEAKPQKVRAAVRAWRVLARLETLEFAAIISPDNNDPPEWAEWSDGAKIESRIARFKRPFEHEDPEKRDPLAFLIVKSMLLTGFDAPIEGVMYLDRPIREAELLQAIARVNRTGYGKTAGIVVDYYGVAHRLKDALAAYSAEDIEGALQSLADEIPKLRDRHTRVVSIFQTRGVDPIHDAEAAVVALADERMRAEFTVKLKHFLATLDLVLPRPEGLPFVREAAALGEVYVRARNRYREGLPPLDKSIGRKVQALIDERVLSLGIDPRIPPIAITDVSFGDQVQKQAGARAKASEMEHALRHHIKKKLDEDPVHYQKLSERLEEILAKFGEDWEQLALVLKDFVEEVKKGREADEGVAGLNPVVHAPFFDVLKAERSKEAPVRSAADIKWLADLTVDLVERIIRDAVSNVGFWKSAPRQEELRDKIFMFLDENEIVDFERADALADRLMELAKANDDKLRR